MLKTALNTLFSLNRIMSLNFSNLDYATSLPSGSQLLPDPKSVSSALLYKLNVSELKPSGLPYHLDQENKLKSAKIRTNIEKEFLSDLKSRLNRSIFLPKNIDDKVEVFNFLSEYIARNVDNRYVNWFEHSATLEEIGRAHV